MVGSDGRSALCSVVLVALSGVIAVPSPVLLAGCLACYSETMGYVWPTDAQRHRVVDEDSWLGVQFFLAKPCLGDPFQDLGPGEPGLSALSGWAAKRVLDAGSPTEPI